ncbi:MAG: tetraacyldisaccharide 4'-kinase [Planctomycetota bacterium]
MIRAALRLGSWVYRFAVWLRNRRYDRNDDLVHRVDVPIICVGNLTTGGTGKTPVVAWLCDIFQSQSLRVSIISRGYGSTGGESNDEALELAKRLPGVPHVQQQDRVGAAQIAVEQLDSQVIVMDDGFQHRRLGRTADLVVIDATNPFGFDALLPRGRMREPLASLRRADAVLISRTESVDPSDVSRIESRIYPYLRSGVSIFRGRTIPGQLINHDGQMRSIDAVSDQRVLAVSAIGNPDAFEAMIKTLGGQVVESFRLNDHASYGPGVITQIEKRLMHAIESVDMIVCTMKDLVKLKRDRISDIPVWAITIGVDINPQHEAEQWLMEQIQKGV